jgi:hypothetical protein
MAQWPISGLKEYHIWMERKKTKKMESILNDLATPLTKMNTLVKKKTRLTRFKNRPVAAGREKIYSRMEKTILKVMKIMIKSFPWPFMK